MLAELYFPAVLIGLAVAGWYTMPRLVMRQVDELALTPLQGRRHVFLYRSWGVGFALIGVTLAVLTLTGR